MAISYIFADQETTHGQLFRRLAVAPDYSAERGGSILATWNGRAVPMLCVRNSGSADQLPTIDYDRSVPWVELPYPPMDIAWCPFKEGAEDASFLTVSRSNPLQLWDVEDAALRASYCCHNRAGMPAQPHSTLWSTHRPFIAAGYGGSDDDVHVRFYDALYEGYNCQSSYRSPCSKGIVCSMADGPSPQQANLLLAGFMRSGNVDVVDTRYAGPAAVLRGLRSGVAQILTNTAAEYLVYASARLGDRRILCWDIRRSSDVLCSFEREVRTQQLVMFCFVRRAQSGGVDLVSATHDGGVLVFDDISASNGRAKPYRVHADVGPTSALALLDSESGVAAVAIGERRFQMRASCKPTSAHPLPEALQAIKRCRSPLVIPELDASVNAAEEGAIATIALFTVPRQSAVHP
ncbi:hypothetical protein ERJ75_001653500 [Trypanosoma vivax]|uniref:Guanine nucleotide-binding protein subunit beta-like protein n=1 Tax=Trypanosoma vivax (strain Y486) TaxID=1055687 RepID=G0U9H3_TRYVY|nr:hypothetical protein TRVL_04029 [Trypanosoma vivax]KAH8605101.1 hypothetical protein ERJ75_001653500 [Trypanosoma vivax]CCC54259.1 conserved hypothetical protein [Trypanosoma vivax Y486]